MTIKIGSRKGFSMIELVLGLTLLVVVIGIGYRALISITRQQTSAANKAARLNLANSTRNAVIDYLGETVSKTVGPGKVSAIQRFDDNDTSGTYLLKYDPGDGKVGEVVQKDHLKLKPELKTSAALTDYSDSKYKIKVQVFPPEAPIFDRRVVVTVRNTDQAKGGETGYEEESFEYFLVRPRASLSGGSVTLRIYNGNDISGDDDPDGALGSQFNNGVRRIKASIEIETGADASGLGGAKTGEVRLARSSSDGLIRIYGLPTDEYLTIRLMGYDRGTLVPYYARQCDTNYDGTITAAEASSCSSSHPSSIWGSNLEKSMVFKCPGTSPEKDLGVIYMWPYTRVTGYARDYDSNTPIPKIGISFKPIHGEIAWINMAGYSDAFYRETAADGTYSIDIPPGFYYRAVYGSVAGNTENPNSTLPTIIQDPDRRNLPDGEPDTDRNNDSGDAYPYGLIDSPGFAHPPKYPAPVIMNEKIVIAKNDALTNPVQSDYPKCMLLRPGVVFTQNSGRTNNFLNTILRLKPMGDYKYTLRLAQWEPTMSTFIDAAVQTPLSTYLSDNGIFLNVFNNFRKVYPFGSAIASVTDYRHVSADNTYVGDRLLYSTEFAGLLGATGGVAAGRAFLTGGEVRGDVPFMGASFFDLDYYQNTFFDATQFDSGSYILPFADTWKGPLTPVIILQNPNNASQQLYVFSHGHPDFTKPLGEWPNGREDGMLYTVNPSMEVFVDENYFPIGTPLPLPTTSPPLSGFSISPNKTGLNAFSASAVHPYRWFRKAFRCDMAGPVISPTPPPIRVLPLAQLSTVRGRILKTDGTPFFDPSNNTSPAQVSTWGVEYTPNNATPSAAGNTGFVNFNYSVNSIPVPIPSSSPSHTFEVTRVIPTLTAVAGVSFGNARKIVAKISATLVNFPMKFFTLSRFYEKKYRAVGSPNFYFEKVSDADVATSGVRLQVTNAQGTGVIVDSGIDSAVGSYVNDDAVASQIISPVPTGTVRFSREYKGESKLFTIKPGQVKSSNPGDAASGAEITNDVDVIMDATPGNTTSPIYYMRLKPDTGPFVDAVAPASNMRGIPISFCTSIAGGSCWWYRDFLDDIEFGFGFYSYYGAQDIVYGYKTLEPGQVKITVLNGGSGVPDVVVSFFTSSMKQYISSKKTNQWLLRCTAKTDASGTIDFSTLGTGSCTNVPGPSSAPFTAFDGFGADKSPGDDPDQYSGLKNIRFRIDSGIPAGKANPCPAADPMACTFHAAEGYDIDFPIELPTITGPAPTNPEQSL